MVFHSPEDALAWCAAVQQALHGAKYKKSMLQQCQDVYGAVAANIDDYIYGTLAPNIDHDIRRIS